MRRINFARDFRDLLRCLVFFCNPRRDAKRHARREASDNRSSCSLRKRGPLHYSADAYRAYRIREAFLIFTNSACPGVRRGAAVRICHVVAWTPVYTSIEIQQGLSEAENARDVYWRITLRFKSIERPSDARTTRKIHDMNMNSHFFTKGVRQINRDECLISHDVTNNDSFRYMKNI